MVEDDLMDSQDSYRSASQLRGAEEKPGVALQARDERAALLADLQALRQECAAAARARDEQLSSLAHELRGPLNSIFGWVQLLQAGRLDSDQQTRALEAIARGVQTQTRLLDELRDSYRPREDGRSRATDTASASKDESRVASAGARSRAIG